MGRRALATELMTIDQLWHVAFGLVAEVQHQVTFAEPNTRKQDTLSHLKKVLHELHSRGTQGRLC